MLYKKIHFLRIWMNEYKPFNCMTWVKMFAFHSKNVSQ